MVALTAFGMHGGGLFRIIVVRFLFHTLGFTGGIILLVVIAAIFFFWRRSRRPGGRRPGPWA